MITLEPIGFVRGGRSDLADDNWGGVTARIELVAALQPLVDKAYDALSSGGGPTTWRIQARWRRARS